MKTLSNIYIKNPTHKLVVFNFGLDMKFETTGFDGGKPSNINIPEVHLLLAVLERAVLDMKASTEKPNPQDVTWIRSRQEILNWFYSRSEQDFSFRGICILIDIDPNWAFESLAGKISALKAAEKITPNPGSRLVLLGDN